MMSCLKSYISSPFPPFFTGENYHSSNQDGSMYEVLLWKTMELDYSSELRENPSISQMKIYEKNF